MAWAPPSPPAWVGRLDAHGAAVGGAEHLVGLDPEELLATASASAGGLADFGPPTWRPHYDVLLRALVEESRLTLVGRLVARTELLRALRQRLLLAARWAEEPSILDEPIVAPVVIVGTARSGTSILHELLALDPTHRAPATWELLHPGEVGGLGIGREAARRRGHEVHAAWADLQPTYATMHRNDGDDPNECIFATMLEFLSDQWSGPFEVPTYAMHAAAADHTDAYRYHRRVLQTLQRERRGERWLLKAPSHLAQLRTLFAVYPDARVVQIHRDPLEAVPSTISLMGTLKSMRCERVDVGWLAPYVSVGYARMLDDEIDARASGELPDEQFVDVRYADLLADPVGTVRSVHERLGIPFTAAHGAAVGAHLAARPQGAAGAHRYSLADTGLDLARESARFARYRERFGVDDESGRDGLS